MPVHTSRGCQEALILAGVFVNQQAALGAINRQVQRTSQGQRRDRDTTGISEFFEKIWKGVALHIDVAIIV